MLSTNCICEECKCSAKHKCKYFTYAVKPVIKAVEGCFFDMSDPFIKALGEALENFTCEYKK